MINSYEEIIESIQNEQLRAQLNTYFLKILPEDANKTEYKEAIIETINKYPQCIDTFIKLKEENSAQATVISDAKIKESELLFITNVNSLTQRLLKETSFMSLIKTHLKRLINEFYTLNKLLKTMMDIVYFM